MITGFFVYALLLIFQGFFFFLPVAVLPQGMLDVFAYVQPVVHFLNSVFPPSAWYLQMIFIVTVEGFFVSFKVANFIYNKLRGSGG